MCAGEVLFGTDSHTCNAGAFGQFASGVGNTDAGFILGTGKLLIKVRPSACDLNRADRPLPTVHTDVRAHVTWYLVLQTTLDETLLLCTSQCRASPFTCICGRHQGEWVTSGAPQGRCYTDASSERPDVLSSKALNSVSELLDHALCS